MLLVDMPQRRNHPLREVPRVRAHQRELHPPSRHIQRVTNALRRSARQTSTDQFRGNGKDQTSGVLLAGVAGPAGEVLHAAVLEVLEAVEGEAGVGYHAHEGGDEAAVEGARAALLAEYGGGGVDDARVDVLSCYLEIGRDDRQLMKLQIDYYNKYRMQ